MDEKKKCYQNPLKICGIFFSFFNSNKIYNKKEFMSKFMMFLNIN